MKHIDGHSERKQRREMIGKQSVKQESRANGRDTFDKPLQCKVADQLDINGLSRFCEKHKKQRECQHSNVNIGTPSLRGVAACKINIESDKKSAEKRGDLAMGTMTMTILKVDRHSADRNTAALGDHQSSNQHTR